jgi:hypothetical protein
MPKRLKLATRALGAEPGKPDVPALAAWISGHRGIPADIITYQLDQSLSPQLSAGIMLPCAGGKFYKERIMKCLLGVDEGTATAEIDLEPSDIQQDAARIVMQKKGAWCALPAPHLLGIKDGFYNDEEEWNDALAGIYRTLMRTMRDSGICGHVLVGDMVLEPEIASQNVFFFQPDPGRDDLAYLMEHQLQVAVRKNLLSVLLDLTGEYDVKKIILVDPDPASVSQALSCLDPDQVIAGGYCTDSCQDYWKNLVQSAVYMS